jgi:hypothetical protein
MKNQNSDLLYLHLTNRIHTVTLNTDWLDNSLL